ncbi:hypothetical protein HDV03_002320 [Kappamyces sp. JEL0829]|nr:hypothetical protein HDV03_002320 [Kappamyces sp. JEL0829]
MSQTPADLEIEIAPPTEQTPLLAAAAGMPAKRTLSPYPIVVAIAVALLAISLSVGVQTQWLLTWFCSKFVSPQGTVAIPAHEWLPGFWNVYPTLQDSPKWDQCRAIPEIQALASKWTMVLSLTTSIPTLVLGPVFGMISDTYGRKLVFCLVFFGLTAVMFAYVLITSLGTGLWAFFIASCILGLFGGVTSITVAFQSYIADTTLPNERAQVFALSEAAIFASSAFGPLLGGYLYRTLAHGARDLFTGVFIWQAVVLVLIVLFLPESHPNPKPIWNRSTSPQDCETPAAAPEPVCASYRKAVAGFYATVKSVSSPAFFCILACTWLVSAASAGLSLLFQYNSFVFGFDSQDEGQFMALKAISSIVGLLVIFPLVKKGFHNTLTSDRGHLVFDLVVLRVALLFSVASTLLIALATNRWNLYAVTTLSGFSILAGPTLNSLISSMVPSNRTGLLFSGILMSTGLLNLVWEVVFPTLWQATIGSRPNAFLFLSAALAGLSALILFLVSPEAVLVARQTASAIEKTE